MLKLKTQDKHTKGLLEQYVSEQTINSNNVLGKFAEATEKQFAVMDTRLENVEEDINLCKASTAELRETALAMQEEQARQAAALVPADRHGSVTRQEINADEFNRQKPGGNC